MKTPRPLITVETRPGVFMRLRPEVAAKFDTAQHRGTDAPHEIKKRTAPKNKKAPAKEHKAIEEPTSEEEA